MLTLTENLHWTSIATLTHHSRLLRVSPHLTDVFLVKWVTQSVRATDISKNVPGEKDQKIFESGVAYFK